MELKFSRRVFLKSAAAAALAVSAGGLAACGSGDLVANAKGLNDTAELRDIKMTVRSLSYGSASDGTFYLVPEVLMARRTRAAHPEIPDREVATQVRELQDRTLPEEVPDITVRELPARTFPEEVPDIRQATPIRDSKAKSSICFRP